MCMDGQLYCSVLIRYSFSDLFWVTWWFFNLFGHNDSVRDNVEWFVGVFCVRSEVCLHGYVYNVDHFSSFIRDASHPLSQSSTSYQLCSVVYNVHTLQGDTINTCCKICFILMFGCYLLCLIIGRRCTE